MNLTDEPASWPVVSSAEVARGRLVTLRTDKVRTPDDELAERDVVLHPGAVAVLALDDVQQVLLIRQYRHPVGRLLWEIPAGLRDVSGETPWATARRELLEEAGYRAPLEQAGLVFSGLSPDGHLVEFAELPSHPFFVGTQAHPEFLSRPTRPHPLFHGLIAAALARSKAASNLAGARAAASA